MLDRRSDFGAAPWFRDNSYCHIAFERALIELLARDERVPVPAIRAAGVSLSLPTTFGLVKMLDCFAVLANSSERLL